jgi:hypothetical protein
MRTIIVRILQALFLAALACELIMITVAILAFALEPSQVIRGEDAAPIVHERAAVSAPLSATASQISVGSGQISVGGGWCQMAMTTDPTSVTAMIVPCTATNSSTSTWPTTTGRY